MTRSCSSATRTSPCPFDEAPSGAGCDPAAVSSNTSSGTPPGVVRRTSPCWSRGACGWSGRSGCCRQVAQDADHAGLGDGERFGPREPGDFLALIGWRIRSSVDNEDNIASGGSGLPTLDPQSFRSERRDRGNAQPSFSTLLTGSHRSGSRPSDRGWGGDYRQRSAFGVSEVTRLPAHASEQQCAFEEGERRRCRLLGRVVGPAVSA